MSTAATFGRLHWLAAAAGEQRRKVIGLIARLGDLHLLEGIKTGISCKFFNMLEQISAAKDEEMRLIGAIEMIEQKHRFKRKHGWLKKARAEEEEELKKRMALDEEREDDCDEEAEWGREDEAEMEWGSDKSPACPYEIVAYDGAGQAAEEKKKSHWLWYLAFWSYVL